MTAQMDAQQLARVIMEYQYDIRKFKHRGKHDCYVIRFLTSLILPVTRHPGTAAPLLHCAFPYGVGTYLGTYGTVGTRGTAGTRACRSVM